MGCSGISKLRLVREAMAPVRRAAAQDEDKFRQHPHDKDDLEQEAMLALLKARGRYDPARSKLSTFASLVAKRQFIDLLRVSSRSRGRDTKFATEKSAMEGATEPSLRHEPEADLAEWLGNIHRQIRQRFTSHHVPITQRFSSSTVPVQFYGRRGKPLAIDLAQAGAVVALKRHRQLTYRGVSLLLEQHPELRAAMGLSTIPTASYIYRAEKALATIKFQRPQHV